MIWTIVFAVLGLVWFYVRVYRGKRLKDGVKGKPIPGPRGRPFVGSAFEIQPETIHLKFTEYAKTYGNIVRIKLFSDNVVLLNDETLIRKAFASEEYKAYFSDRSGMFYGRHFRADNRSVAFVEHGLSPFQKVAKKAYIQALHVYGSGVQTLESTVKKELVNIVAKLDQLAGKPFDAVQVVQRSLSNVVSLFLIGELLSIEDSESDFFWQHVRVADFFLNASNDMVLTTFPFLRFLPGKYGHEYRLGKAANAKIAKHYFHDIKKTHVTGVHRGLVDWYIDEQTKQKESGSEVVFTDDEIIAQIVETVDAGLSTSSAAMTSSILILMNHPEIQAKLQEELYRVIGTNNEPSVNDRDKCVYFKAFEMEVHRYVPVLPILLPRLCRQHVVFEGYEIQPNTVVFGNIWSLHHNEEIWGDPWTFRPERFLDEDGQLLPREHKFIRNDMAFGIGHRLCPGERFAKIRYFLYLATLLRRWTFSFPEGQSISCDPRNSKALVAGIILKTNTYKCCANSTTK